MAAEHKTRTDIDGKKQMDSDVRLISLPLATVAKGMVSFLSDEGYDVQTEGLGSVGSKITFSARNQQRSYGKLFMSQMPQQLNGLLEQTALSQTKATLKASATPALRCFTFGVPLLFAFLTFAVLPAICLHTPESLWGCVLWLLLGLNGLISGIFLLGYGLDKATHGYRTFLSRLYSILTPDTGMMTSIHVGTRSYSLGDILVFTALLCTIAGLTMEWLPFWLLASCFLGAMLLISPLWIGRISWRRSGAFATGFVSSLILMAYGILPLWGYGILHRLLANLALPEALALPPTARALLSLIVIALLSLLPVAIIALIMIINPSHFTTDSREQMHRDRASWQRHQPSGWRRGFYRAFVLLGWAITGGLMTWSIYLSLGCLEAALPIHRQVVANAAVLQWAELNRIIVFVIFGGFLPHSALLVLSDTLLFLYSLPLVLLFILHLREHIRVWMPRFNTIEDKEAYSQKTATAQCILNELALAHSIRPPVIRPIFSKSIDMHVGLFLLKRTPRSIFVTTTALCDLSPDALEGLLAHETGHIVLGHARTLSFLHFLSIFSPCGVGSLTLLCDPVKTEQQADQFAAKWMTQKYGKKEGLTSMTNALNAIETSRISASISKAGPRTEHIDSLELKKPGRHPIAVLRRAACTFMFDYRRGWQLAYVHSTHSNRLTTISEYGSGI